MAVLKSCPFCGGEAELNYIGSCIPLHFISCKECGCKQASSIHKEAVIKAWNTRNSMEAVVAELEKLKDKAAREYEKTCCTGGYEHDYADGASDAYDKAISIVRGKE